MKRKHIPAAFLPLFFVFALAVVLFSLFSASIPSLSVAPVRQETSPTLESSLAPPALPVQAKVRERIEVVDTILDVPYLSQEGILPTGCEVVSAAMVLQYWGIDITAPELAEMLPCSSLYEEKGEFHGPDPNEYFVGSPFDPYSYGCYAPVIADVVSDVEPSLTAQVLYDCSLEELYGEYVSQGIPVLLWCTINMVESYDGAAWTLPDGSSFTWRSNEHCLVLAGREGEEYICMDSYDSNGQVSIPFALLEQRYEELGSQAVVMIPNE